MIFVLSELGEFAVSARKFAEKWGYRYVSQWSLVESLCVHYSGTGIELCIREKKKFVKVNVDFVAGSVAHRRKFGGGKGQLVAKAVGLNKGIKPAVLDLTAGQGRDAFVLASLGCSITMIERSPVAHLLLHDGLTRAKKYASEEDDEDLASILSRMCLYFGDSLSLSGELDIHDVVYLDPMFPERKKSASVKKEMKAFHDVIGSDDDASGLLETAKQLARYRVVVKRPRIAPFLNDEKPTYQLEGKSSRFDVYVNKAFSES